MIKFVALLAFMVCLHAGAPTTHAQQQEPPPLQSLQQTPSLCGPGSQSVRVCNDDFRSCNSVCAARALDPSEVIAGCTTRCCTQFNVCLRMRGCGTNVINCN